MVAEHDTKLKVPLFIISDGTGETVEKIVKAVLIQYGSDRADVTRFKNVRTPEQVEFILDDAKECNAAVVFTAVSPVVRDAINAKAIKLDIFAVDLLAPLLNLFGRYFDQEPSYKPGLLHSIDENYFKRIEAIEFTVKQDDGACPENLERADIILVGVSRTSKTPLSIFLSHKGWKVANVPLVMGIEPPQELFKIEQKKIVGLIIDEKSLSKIRKERLVRMGREPTGEYASHSTYP